MIDRQVSKCARRAGLLLILNVALSLELPAAQVVLSFQAEASTVVGSPFGLTIPRLAMVKGTLVYETSGAVDQNGSPERGHYQLGTGGAFSARFEDSEGNGHFLAGSVSPWLEVENISVSEDATIDTFRFWDGDDSDSKGGLMSFDGEVDGDFFLTFAMTDSGGGAFAGDDLPELFAMTGVKGPTGYPYPHTFVIGNGSGADGSGRMLLQLISLTQKTGVVEGPAIRASRFEGGVFVIDFDSEVGEVYSIEFSNDLESWETIATEIPAEGVTTSFGDSGVRERLGNLPGVAYYRVRMEGN